MSLEMLSLNSTFMPHGMCFLWRRDILTLSVVSDGLIALAYFSISSALLYFVKKRGEPQNTWAFGCFGFFIFACGITHLMEIVTIWYPLYWVAGAIKLVTALASVITAILVFRYLPDALAFPRATDLLRTNVELKRLVGEGSTANEALQDRNTMLENSGAEQVTQLSVLNRALIVERSQHEGATDASGAGFFDFNVATNELKWDERMFRLYGLSPSADQRLYSRWTNQLHVDDRERCVREWADALAAGDHFDSEFRVQYPTGTIRALRTSARITRDKAGHAVHAQGVTFDVTERNRADEQFRLAIEAAPTGMLLMNMRGIIVMVNAQIEHIFGYSRAELIGQPIEMLVPERFHAHHPAFRRGFFDAPRARAMGAGRELYGLRRDGVEVPVEIGLNPLETPDGKFVLSSIVDLTLRQDFDRLRSEFVSTVSHELRTPLTSISGSLGLLQSGALGPLPEKVAAMVRIASENSDRLVKIINDILDIGKLEAGQLALQMALFPMFALLERSVEANAGYAEKCDVGFMLEGSDDGAQVSVDADRIMQVLTNFLSNAAKFSATGSLVRVRMKSCPTTVRVEVEDSGPGISESFQSRIFEKFAQAESSTTRRFQGTGLGLSISKKLIEAMGGSIGYTTVVGSGTIFYFDLPKLAVES